MGDYICEVSSNPPETLRHRLSMLGKKEFAEILLLPRICRKISSLTVAAPFFAPA